MSIRLQELIQTDSQITDITLIRFTTTEKAVDYTKNGRHKNFIFYCIKGKNDYFSPEKEPLFSIKENDVLFIADQTKYYVERNNNAAESDGFYLCFNVRDPQGNPLKITDDFHIFQTDASNFFYQKFQDLHLKVLRNQPSIFAIKSGIFELLNELLTRKEENGNVFSQLAPAVHLIESEPQNNLSMKQLAALCHMSESDFAHKFTQYFHISPLRYKNRLRLMQAEEMANSTNLSIDSIAQSLGFYDASYLCRYYKKQTGRTLKKQK